MALEDYFTQDKFGHPCQKCAHWICEIELNTHFYSMFWINWQDQNQSFTFILPVTHRGWCNLYNLLHRIWVHNIKVFGIVQWVLGELNEGEICSRWPKSSRNRPLCQGGPTGLGLGIRPKCSTQTLQQHFIQTLFQLRFHSFFRVRRTQFTIFMCSSILFIELSILHVWHYF